MHGHSMREGEGTAARALLLQCESNQASERRLPHLKVLKGEVEHLRGVRTASVKHPRLTTLGRGRSFSRWKPSRSPSYQSKVLNPPLWRAAGLETHQARRCCAPHCSCGPPWRPQCTGVQAVAWGLLGTARWAEPPGAGLQGLQAPQPLPPKWWLRTACLLFVADCQEGEW
jgi:hypothetical protein